MSTWDAVRTAVLPERVGEVSQLRGLSVHVRGLDGAIGDMLTLGAGVDAEVVASGDDGLRCMPLASISGLTVGAAVRARGGALRVPTGRGLLGRVLDGLGRPIDGKGPVIGPQVGLAHDPPSIMGRDRIDAPLPLGVRALDTLASVGRGQRVGLFAGSGVGKSSLLSMVARGTEAEVTVIALVGERGREVREFIEDDLGEEGLARSVVIVSTSDQPAMARIRAAFTATRIAEAFRDEGAHAILMMDSLTRVAMAQREIGLSAGEPPATRGYPPSTFSMLAGLLERAGTDRGGSVTGIYTVLVDGDDHNEPIADAVRSILDGHIVLDRALALSGHHPAIDVLASVSRVAGKVTSSQQRTTATTLRAVLAARRRANDLIDIGAYQSGADAKIDAAIANERAISAFLTQSLDETSPIEESWRRLDELVSAFGGIS
ncbi:FliI/YscN family ATPase [Microbacterium murale]|uniref:Flagellar protein export ATPase FliI n=1 Tax=Microbacterium murale TaxID=1081040 RepID=A0ABQ1RM32_9MICO|nr:FliI/YscN family ATPase [Microbacterium murale]GGD75078.1 flagellar protein export ATPase FliI [Microbacterium murale]